MPLRDHFHPPLDNMRHSESFLASWPVMIVAGLNKKMPRRYFAEPYVFWGSSVEVDICDGGEFDFPLFSNGNERSDVEADEWNPPRPAISLATDLPAQDVYEVRVYDEKRRSSLVAAVEIISPSNKDHPTHRQAFVAKCLGMLRERVSVVLIDMVTTRTANLYGEMLETLELADPWLNPESPLLYAVACRTTKMGNEWQMDAWSHTLDLGRPLPTLPLWLADNLAVPLELEESYEQSCDILGIP